jgi:UDP-N-acetylmuramoyl-tripeptide--D-alanyl-D-alanine ligase
MVVMTVAVGELADAVEAGIPAGLLIVDGTADQTAEGVVCGLKALAELGRLGRRTVAVVGPLTGADWQDHDRVGRMVVRLDIRSLVAVGHGTRHLHAAAGLEGSWDGEAVLVADEDAAYDEVRAGLRGDEVVLVTLPGALARLQGVSVS